MLYLSGSASGAISSAPNAGDRMTDSQMETIYENSQNRQELQRVYVAAQSRVAALVAQYGKDAGAWLVKQRASRWSCRHEPNKLPALSRW